MVAGDVMNSAARIQAAAPIDGILVSGATHGATERVIVYRSHAAVEAKGKADPVEVWEAVEARGRVGGLVEDPSSPLVGRDSERALLLGAFARVRVDRSPQLVTLVGVPGIGKSRLVGELGRAVEEDEEIITWRYGRCLPYGDGVSFWALGEIVKAQAGIHENDDAGVTAAKLGTAVDDLVPAVERAWVLSSLEPLVGLVPEDVGLSDRRRRALCRLADLPRVARRAPSARPRDRRPALGRRRVPRLRGRARRPRRGRAAPRRRERPARAARAATGLGRGQAERAHGLARPAPRGRDGSPRGVSSRTRSGRRGPPGDGRRAIGRQPVVRRGVRPDADVRR